MFSKNGIVYADFHKYLKHKRMNLVALHVHGNMEDYDEVPMTLPIKIKIKGDMITWNDGILACIPEKLEYSSIKERIIKSRYSNDEQIAIMLNKDKDGDYEEFFNRMQQWRDFAKEIAGLASNDQSYLSL